MLKKELRRDFKYFEFKNSLELVGLQSFSKQLALNELGKILA